MRLKVLAAVVIVGAVAAVTTTVILSTSNEAATSRVSGISTYVTKDSIAALTRDSTIVVIGTYVGQKGTRTAPSVDPARPTADAGRMAILGDYEISVERYLKGNGSASLTFSQVEGYEHPKYGRYLFPESQAEPLEQGTRYIIFLTASRMPSATSATSPTAVPTAVSTTSPAAPPPTMQTAVASNELRPTAEPWRFKLENRAASPQSPVRFPDGQFPASEQAILNEIEAAE